MPSNSTTLTVAGCGNGNGLMWSTGEQNAISIVVRPQSTTTYSATCTTGPGCSGITSLEVTVSGLAQVDLDKRVSHSRARFGEVVSYTVVLANTGTREATQVVVSDTYSAGVSVVPGSVSVSLGQFTPNLQGGTWTVASLPIGATATLTFSASLLSEGVLFNTASIPGDTATVCTSVPVQVCKGQPFSVSLSAPAGYATYQWYRNGTAIALATGESYTATEIGEYSIRVNQGQCPPGSCCPVLIEEVEVPTFVVLTKSPTCVGGTPQADGQLLVRDLGVNVNQYTYAISEGSSFTLTNPTVQPVPADGVLSRMLSGDRPYTVRIYNPLGCYRDVKADLLANCQCPANLCMPVIIKKTKSRGIQQP